MPISKLSTSSARVSYKLQCTAHTPTHARTHLRTYPGSLLVPALLRKCTPFLSLVRLCTCSYQHLTLHPLHLLLPSQEDPAAVTALQRELGQLTLSEGAGLGFGKVRACVFVRMSVAGRLQGCRGQTEAVEVEGDAISADAYTRVNSALLCGREKVLQESRTIFAWCVRIFKRGV